MRAEEIVRCIFEHTAPAKQADWRKVREVFVLAHQAAAQCSTPGWQACALAWIATRQAEIGDFVSARSSLQQAIDFQAIDIGQNVRHATLLVDLAEEHARKQGTHGRLHEPQPIGDENWRRQVARSQIGHGGLTMVSAVEPRGTEHLIAQGPHRLFDCFESDQQVFVGVRE